MDVEKGYNNISASNLSKGGSCSAANSTQSVTFEFCAPLKNSHFPFFEPPAQKTDSILYR